MRTLAIGLRRARGLAPEERRAFLRAWAVLLAADLALRLLPFPRVERLFAPRARAAAEADPSLASRLVWATGAAARHHLYPMRCLPQSLCLRWLLGRHGVVTDLRIGVTRRRGSLIAHAWVEREGRPLGEGGDVAERFAPLGGAVDSR